MIHSILPKSLLTSLFLLGLAGAGTRSYAQYCIPTCTTPCTMGGGDYINSFSTTGGSTNISNLNSGCNGNPNNYVAYTNQVVTAAQAGTITWSFTNCPTNQEGYGIWVDWNHNGSFSDPGENIYLSPGNIAPSATVTGTVTVPLTATPGNGLMRVRCYYANTNPTACNSMFYGETEDYVFNVSGTVLPCTSPPTAGTISASPTPICLSSPTTLHLTGNTANTTIQWQSATNPPAWTNIAGATGAYLQLPSPTPTASYRAVVNCSGTTYTDTTAAFAVNPSNNTTACQDSVWPGDANYDHVVNNYDALYIGLAYNYVGSARAGASINWNAQYSTNWSTTFGNGVNHKNADCNGDSLVTSADVAAVTANYGLTHPRNGYAPNAAKVSGLPDLYVDTTGLVLLPGSNVTAPIKFGSSTSLVNKIYGIAGTLTLMGISPAASPVISFTPTWLGTAANTLPFAKGINSNTTDWAVVRTNQANTNGYGTLGAVSFTVPLTATGQVTFHLQNVTVIDSAGAVLTGYNVVDHTASIHTSGVPQTSSVRYGGVIIPNPTSGSSVLELTLQKAGSLELRITDMTGKTVWAQSSEAGAGMQQIALPSASMAAGIYTVHINAGDLHQTLRWVRQ